MLTWKTDVKPVMMMMIDNTLPKTPFLAVIVLPLYFQNLMCFTPQLTSELGSEGTNWASKTCRQRSTEGL